MREINDLHAKKRKHRLGAKPAAIEPRPWRPDTSRIDATVRAQAEAAAVRCELRLPEEIIEELVAVAPSALAMAARLGRQHAREEETASTFDPGRAVD